MKPGKVQKLLNVSNPTLRRYLEKGYLKATKLPSGHYDYDDDSVYQFLNKKNRLTVSYIRTSEKNNLKELEKQRNRIKGFCERKDIKVDREFCDISDGISMSGDSFLKLIKLVLDDEIDNIVVVNKHLIFRSGYKLLQVICQKFKTKIIEVDKRSNEANNEGELLYDLQSLLNNFISERQSKKDQTEANDYE